MKLTAVQLCEVMLALNHGLSAAAWEGISPRPWWELSDEEKAAVLASVRAALEKSIRRQNNPDPDAQSFNQLILDRMTLASVQNEERLEREGREKALSLLAARRRSTSGLRQAINDLLSQSALFGMAQTRAVERRLAARNLPTLAMLEAIMRNQHEKILKRGRIRTEEEYYLVQEILAFIDFPIDEDTRQQLAGFAYDFESRRKSS